jgi:hypothetical protein
MKMQAVSLRHSSNESPSTQRTLIRSHGDVAAHDRLNLLEGVRAVEVASSYTPPQVSASCTLCGARTMGRLPAGPTTDWEPLQ